MLAVRLHAGDHELHFDDIEMPVAQTADQLVVKVNACGVCFSDIHVVDGDFGDKPRPLTLGHEEPRSPRSTATSSSTPRGAAASAGSARRAAR